MTTPERLVGVRGDYLFDTLVSAVRGHLGIRASDLVDLARARDLTVPTGDPAARGPEWAALLEALAGVAPLPSGAGRPLHLMAIVRDLIDVVEGPSVPAAPALFSMMIDCPRCFSVALASARMATSVVPPAGQGTIIVTGRVGKFCACAAAQQAATTIAAASGVTPTTRFIGLPPRRGGLEAAA